MWRPGARAPAAARDLVAPGEQVLGWAEMPGGHTLAATGAGLYSSPGLLGGLPSPLAWDLIDRAVWDPPVLRLEARAEVRGPARTVQVRLPDGQRLSPVVQDYVTASVLLQRRFEITGAAGVMFVARRRADGSVRWMVRPDPGLDMGDPQVRARVDALLADTRATLGV